MSLGDKIKEIRNERKLTQGQLAAFTGFDRSYISQMEAGKRENPTVETLVRLAKPLKVNVSTLINAVDEFNIEISTTEIPVYGVIFAGSPMGAEQDIQGMVTVPDNIVEKYGINNLIALKISGDSMDKVVPDGTIGIFNTDYEPIQNGHIYAVLIDDTEATLKRVYKYESSVRFEPDSNNPEQKSWTYTTDMETEVDYVGELVYFSREL